MKKIGWMAALAALGLAAATQAAVITVESAYYGAGDQTATVSGGGTVSLEGGIVTDSSSPSTLTYTISGLDLGGTATADSVNFQIVLATVSGVDFGHNAAGSTFGDGTWVSTSGVTWNYVADSFTVNIDGVADSGSGTFDGFKAVNFNNYDDNNEGAIVTTDVDGAVTFDSTPMTQYDFALSDSIAMKRVDGSAGTFKASVIDFQFTAIPEPATLGLVAAFGGGILFIRRRLML